MKKNLKIQFIILLIVALAIIPIASVNAENKNNNPLLREILIDGEAIEPEFDQFITEYVISTEKDKVDIKAVSDDPNAKVEIIGNTNLSMGKNDIEIKVTAEDGKTTQSYYLHITRGDSKKANANLKNLKVEGLQLNPLFNSKDINYHVEYQGTVNKLNIIATPESENAKVEITGNENYDTILHTVKIIVTAEDGITTKTYQIIAKKAEVSAEDPSGLNEITNETVNENVKVEENEKDKQVENELQIGNDNEKSNYLLYACIIIAIAVIIVVAAILKKKKDR